MFESIPSLPSLRKKLIKVIKALVQDALLSRYLDVGCGDGSLTLEIAKLVKAREIYGVDISDKALKVAQRRGIIAVKADLNSDMLPFPNNYFDLVTAIEVIEHLVNTDNLLQNVWRVLKPGGLFILSTPNMCSWLNRVLLMLGYLPLYYEVSTKWRVGKPLNSKVQFNPSGHVRLYNLRALKEHLEAMGFKIVKVYGASIYQFNKAVEILDKVFSIIPSIASDIIIVARKA